MKRHELLEFKIKEPDFLFNTYLPERLSKYQVLTQPGSYNQISYRFSAIDDECCEAALEHLGFGPIQDVQLHLNRGMDYCVEFYLSDWWRQQPTPEIIKSHPGDWKFVCEIDAMSMDKTRPDWEFGSLFPICYTFMLGGLTNRWADVERISQWFDEAFDRKYRKGLIDDEFELLLLCMAIQTSQRKTNCLNEMIEIVRKAKSKRTKLLCEAWEAAVAKDQAAFDKAFADGLKIFVAKEMDDGPNFMLWMAVKDTAVWAIAERNGLRFPKLNDKCEAVVIRRETIGLT